jgi:O-antigen ligase
MLGVGLLLVGMPTSPVLQSLGVLLWLLGGLVQRYLPGFGQRLVAGWMFLVLYVLHFLSFAYTTHTDGLLEELRIKLPFLLLPVAASLSRPLHAGHLRSVLLAFVAVTSLVALATLTHYLIHFQEMNQRILQSKEVPIITLSQVSHIYFSLLNAFAVFVSVWLLRHPSTDAAWLRRRWVRRGLWAALGLLTLVLHIFAARTGLVAFYAAVMTWALGTWWHQRRASPSHLSSPRRWLAGLVLGVVLVPLVAYALVPSFRNRVVNTQQDITQYLTGRDISHWSIARRLAAWQTALAVWRTSPIWGVGLADAKAALLAQYPYQDFTLRAADRITDTHNQYLEYLLGLGLVGFGVFVVGLVLPYVRPRAGLKPDWLFTRYTWVLCVGMLAESVLERQVGVSFGCAFWLLLHPALRADGPGPKSKQERVQTARSIDVLD